ncbi:MAG: FRG domain-containing protein [Lentisphaerae bacterium]|nr:FRG domain-containing protein [Lentisphaerota bacterium]
MKEETMSSVNPPLHKLTEQDLFQEQTFNLWEDFISAIMGHRLGFGVKLWRGQGNSAWKLESSYWRKHKKNYCAEQVYSTFVTDIYNAYNNLRRNTFSERDDISNHLSLPLPSRPNNYIFELKKCESEFAKFNRQSNNNDNINFGVALDCSCNFAMDLRHWAWGQHYGVKSPLLDWTIRPLLALYFACEGYKEKDQDGNNIDMISIYSLDPSLLVKLNTHPINGLDKITDEVTQEHINEFIDKTCTFFNGKIFSKDNLKSEIKVGQPEIFFKYYQIVRDAMKLKLILECSDKNQRQITQNGVFSYAPRLMTIEEWCERYFATFTEPDFDLFDNLSYTRSEPPEKSLIKKYNIKFSISKRKDCLAFLDSANINAKTVYPDFQGLSKYMDELEEIRWF